MAGSQTRNQAFAELNRQTALAATRIRAFVEAMAAADRRASAAIAAAVPDPDQSTVPPTARRSSHR